MTYNLILLFTSFLYGPNFALYKHLFLIVVHWCVYIVIVQDRLRLCVFFSIRYYSLFPLIPISRWTVQKQRTYLLVTSAENDEREVQDDMNEDSELYESLPDDVDMETLIYGRRCRQRVGVTKRASRRGGRGSLSKQVGDDGDPGENRDPKGRAKEQMLTPRASCVYDN